MPFCNAGIRQRRAQPSHRSNASQAARWGDYRRSFAHGHVQQLDAVSSRLLAGLATRAPGLAGGGPGGVAFLDVDDSIREVHGHAKQAAAYGYIGVRERAKWLKGARYSL
jgi:hypothetical protein